MVEAPHTNWKARFEQTIVPETFVEITMGVIDVEATRYADRGGGPFFSGTNSLDLVGVNENTFPTSFATLEENLWTLDGTKKIRPKVDSWETGFVGYHDTNIGYWHVDFDLQEVTNALIPGFIVVWSSEYGETPTSFTVTFENTSSINGARSTLLFENGKIKEVLQNDHGWDVSKISLDNSIPHIYRVTGEFTNYNHVRIEFEAWDTPNHRPRFDRLVLGYTWGFSKKDILSYTHEQTADLICAELPKNSITFSLDNTDDKWNPYNPNSMGKYLTDRQIVTVRYGLDVNSDGYVQWIPGGTFYLSEWNAPANGLEATFTARDAFEFMLNTPYTGAPTGSLVEIVDGALNSSEFPTRMQRYINSAYKENTVTVPAKSEGESYSAAEVIQMAVSAMSGTCWFDRDGVLRIVRMPWVLNTDSVYDITPNIAYSHPEVTLNKPVKSTKVSYTLTDGSTKSHLLDLGLWESGETQTIDNPLIQSNAMAVYVAEDTKCSLGYREQVTGVFRSDPRLDIFDWVNVSGKYGDMSLVITGVKYTYTGCFHGEYTARKVCIPESFVEGEDNRG